MGQKGHAGNQGIDTTIYRLVGERRFATPYHGTLVGQRTRAGSKCDNFFLHPSDARHETSRANLNNTTKFSQINF